MSLQATGTRIIIERLAAERQTLSGIVLQGDLERPNARVISVGPSSTIGVAPGAVLVVDWSKCGQFEHEGRTYHLVDESTVLAVLE